MGFISLFLLIKTPICWLKMFEKTPIVCAGVPKFLPQRKFPLYDKIDEKIK
jgi:hypothetical protein